MDNSYFRSDKSWNDPPMFSMDQLNKASSTVPLSKRYRYPQQQQQQQHNLVNSLQGNYSQQPGQFVQGYSGFNSGVAGNPVSQASFNSVQQQNVPQNYGATQGLNYMPQQSSLASVQPSQQGLQQPAVNYYNSIASQNSAFVQQQSYSTSMATGTAAPIMTTTPLTNHPTTMYNNQLSSGQPNFVPPVSSNFNLPQPTYAANNVPQSTPYQSFQPQIQQQYYQQ